MRYSFPLALLLFASVAFAQTSSNAKPDSSAAVIPSVQRPLPPSMLAELRRSQKNRTLVYHDTLHASDLVREHFNDSVSHEYADSAISLVDTAVSLPQKEWLDSELIEIPELVRFGARVHYSYPPSLVMQTDLRPVPFDSTLIERMNPVTRENLPYFDQSPIPMPMPAPPERSESFIEAGGGNVMLPRVAGWFAQTLSERSAMSVTGEYQSLDASQSAVHNFGNIIAELNSQLGEDPAIEAYHSQDLNVTAGYAVKNVATNNISTSDHALSQFSGLASMNGDISQHFHYNASVADHELSDGLSTGTTESSQDVALGTRFDLSNIRAIVEGNYSLASLFSDTNVVTGSNFFGGTSTPIHAESAKALVGERNRDSTEYYVGLEYLGGSGVDGSSYSSVMPVLRGRMLLNPVMSIGAAFEPQVQLASVHALTLENPFYAPELIFQAKQNGTSIPESVDERSVVMDKINLAAFVNYMLSPDDELRIEVRYITRDREPVFNEISMKDTNVFTVTPESTERFDLTAAGNFLLFSRDVLSGSAEFCSATLASGGTIPFEPNAKLDLQYHFNSIWDNVRPSLAFDVISRPGQTFTFIDVNVDAQLSHAVALMARIENILGGASDFWPGYPEKPRSIWAMVRYMF